MTRVEEAKELKKQGFSFEEIATKMKITEGTAKVYVYTSPDYRPEHYLRKDRRKKFGEKIRAMIIKELEEFNLPFEWEDELVKMFVVYHYSARERGGPTKVHIQSLIQLLCRRYKVPTPRKLEISTSRGSGARRRSSGYMDVLRIINGVSISKPIDYVKHFIEREELPNEVISRAEELIKKIPKIHRQSKNPRVLAGAVLYEIHKPIPTTTQRNRIYTQRYIADKLQVTPQSLRTNWVKFFKDEEG